MRGRIECDPRIIAEYNALNERRPAPKLAPVDQYDLSTESFEAHEALTVAEMDSILSGYGVGKAERLHLTEHGGSVEDETLTPWWEQ